MQVFPAPPTTRGSATGAMTRMTTFEVAIPHLDDTSGSGVFSPSMISSPIRASKANYEAAGGSSSVPQSVVRASAMNRTDSARYNSLSNSNWNSTTRCSVIPDGDGNGVAGAGTTTTNPLTKPTLASSSIRFCSQDQWVPDAHVVNCMAPDCSTSFSLFNRKYHCKMCGRVFCSSCCSFVVTILTATTGAPTTGSVSGGGTAVPVNTAAAAGGSVSAVPENASLAGTAVVNSLAAAISGAPHSPTNPSPILSSRASFAGSRPLSTDAMGASVIVAASSPPAAATVSSTFRVCNSCRYELHLVISTRQENGERRRKSRGELKMFQWALVVNVLSFLPLPSLLEMALVSSDFYFMTKDNVIWYQYNMMRWLKDAEQTQTQLSIASSAAAKTARSGFGFRSAKNGTTSSFKAASVLQDATALTESEAAKRVISLHARYNFTQFLDFTRRQEMARCEGLSSFSVGSRILLSSPVKVALIGPRKVGKTTSVRNFVECDTGDAPKADSSSAIGRDSSPTVGFVRSVKTVRLVGDLSTDVTLHIYDISGEPRYEALRRFICAQCHAIGLCYDPASKVTLVEAADMMMGIEMALGPQPVVVCGLLRSDGADDKTGSTGAAPPGNLAVSEEDAIAITVRTAGSLQCPVTQCEPFYTKLLQCLLDRLAMATMVGNATVADISGEVTDPGSVAASAHRRAAPLSSIAASTLTSRSKASKVTAQELLNLTMQPCALDILLDPK